MPPAPLVGRQPLEKLLEQAEALGQGGRPNAGVLALDEDCLDVLTPHVGDAPRPSVPRLREEQLELRVRLRVGHDRRRRLGSARR